MHSGNNTYGTADGLGYGIWESGSGGSITVFPNAHAFSASWTSASQDFLAHLGLDFSGSQSYTTYGTITAQFSEIKNATGVPWSSIGMYGWMHSPCIEWYINEDSFNGLYGGGGTTVTIDGGMYALTSQMTNGTGGANDCESGHQGEWMQIHSTRTTARTCGTITVSDHFKAWAAQGWTLGNLASVHVNVEVGGGSGSIDFPVANVTTSSGN
jgi:endo-1,4-beta-xylanase